MIHYFSLLVVVDCVAVALCALDLAEPDSGAKELPVGGIWQLHLLHREFA